VNLQKNGNNTSYVSQVKLIRTKQTIGSRAQFSFSTIALLSLECPRPATYVLPTQWQHVWTFPEHPSNNARVRTGC